MKKRIDMTGKVFGKWTVLYFHGRAKTNAISLWMCRCECGTETPVASNNLTGGKSTRCVACSGGKGRFMDLTGKQFGRLTVQRLIEKKIVPTGTVAVWECLCECGNSVPITGGNLRSGNSTQCRECYYKSMPGSGNGNYKHGSAPGGAPPTITYNSWASLIQRCTDPANVGWSHYGGDGVRVCQAWRDSFQQFALDMGDRPSKLHSIDRVNSTESTRHYSCGHCSECLANGWEKHCRWATDAQQTRNKSNNRMLTFEGRTMCVTDWAQERHINAQTLFQRLNKRWSIAKALTTPVRLKQHKS